MVRSANRIWQRAAETKAAGITGIAPLVPLTVSSSARLAEHRCMKTRLLYV